MQKAVHSVVLFLTAAQQWPTTPIRNESFISKPTPDEHLANFGVGTSALCYETEG